MFETVLGTSSGQRERLESILEGYQYTQDTTGDVNHCKIPPELALRVYDILQNIAARAKAGEFDHVGVSIAIVHQPKNSDYILSMDDDYFEGKEVSIYHPTIADQIAESCEFDGGITIDAEGDILEAGVMFTSNPKKVLEDMGIPNHRKLPARFGFSEPVGTRHISAISASYRIPDALIFMLSEENNTVRAFYCGKIINSPHEEETVWREKEETGDVYGSVSLPYRLLKGPEGNGLEAT